MASPVTRAPRLRDRGSGLQLGGHLAFSSIVMFLRTGLIPFLMKNWNAKVFLGDNGSLPLGFLISCVSLTPAGQNTWLRSPASSS